MARTSRRRFLQGTALIGVGAVLPGAGVALSSASRVTGVGAIFNEQAYLDLSGLVREYRPPIGACGLAATAALDEIQFRMAHPYA